MQYPEVAIVTPGSFPIPFAGSSSVEHAVAEIARELARSGECGVTVFGLRAKGFPAREQADGVTYRRPGGRRGYIGSVIAALKKRPYALIQVENRPRYARRIKRALPSTPVWLSLHSLTFVQEKRIRPRLLEACFRAADLILVNSRFLQDELARMVPSQAHKLRVNYLGANVEQFISRWTPDGVFIREQLLAKHGLSGKKVLLFVGRLLRMKGVHRLIKAMPFILGQHPDTVLVLVGSPYYGSKRTTRYSRWLHRLARSLPKGTVRFVPYVPHDRIQRWFLVADIALVPSSSREAFGLVNVEAMSSGIPVIATRAGGMAEIIEPECTGALVDEGQLEEELAAAANRLLGDEALRRMWGENGRLRVLELFHWRATAERWLTTAGEQGLLVRHGGTGSGLSERPR